MKNSSNFSLLHEGAQKWVWNQGWDGLRDIQEEAIQPIMSRDTDVIISASTASGKTEAAFLPAISIVVSKKIEGIGIVYISPLKALINDQLRRLESLCESVHLEITAWHGDASQAKKKSLKDNPDGVLLITPESLESILMRDKNWVTQAFKDVQYFIIDEFHAFIGNERGMQLQSLLHRVDTVTGKSIPRVALSATISNLEEVARILRPKSTRLPKLIESNFFRNHVLCQLRGYSNPFKNQLEYPKADEKIAKDLHKILRNRSNLVFANTRQNTEWYSSRLRDMCEESHLPNEFFPHHGNLSRENREYVEQRLLKGDLPTTAICTMTLELGIDIGKVDSIAQVGSPWSVASLRQRVGRAGRRDASAELRLFIAEDSIEVDTALVDRLRMHTIQSLAIVNLMVEKWCEPPPSASFHFSTLVQQSLSVIAQYGSVNADRLWKLLCKTGPFELVTPELFEKFLRSIANHQLISQMQNGSIVLGIVGERLVADYSFYAAFSSPEEYRLESEGRSLGSLPITFPPQVDDYLIFAGRRWLVKDISQERRVIVLSPAKAGDAPKFGGNGGLLHDRVRNEMFRILSSKAMPQFVDKVAKAHLLEAFATFHDLKLQNLRALSIGSSLYLFPWLGDRVIQTISALLKLHGLRSTCELGVIEVVDCSDAKFHEVVKIILSGRIPTGLQLSQVIDDIELEKHDKFIGRELLEISYSAKRFDIPQAFEWIESLSLKAKQ